MKKRMISLLLCVVMLIGLLPTSALAASIPINPYDPSMYYNGSWEDEVTHYQYKYQVYRDTTKENSFYAELTGVELTGVAIDPAVTGIILTIPGTFPYTPAGEGQSERQIPLRVISGTVSGDVLKSVSIPDSVEIIDAEVFKNHKKLETVTFGESSRLRKIGDSAFSDCSNLTACALPETVEEIGSKAFYSTGLISVTFGSKLTTLGESAFAYCGSLSKLDMSKATNLTAIPKFCFSNHNLTRLTIPYFVTTIGDWAFQGHETSLGEGSQTLQTLVLESGVQTIGQFAFYKNKGLTGTLTLPDSVSSIGKCAFGGCGFTDVKWPQGNGDFTEVNGFSQCRSLSGAAIASLPVTVTTIGEEAFSDCIELDSVTIPSSVTTIKKKAFSNAGITSLTIKYGVETIETNAFQGCTDLLGTEITIPASVTTLASGAFSELFTINGTEDAPLTVKVMKTDLVLAEATGVYQYFDSEGNKHTTGDAFAGCVNLILYAPAGDSTARAYKDKFNGVTIRAIKENINYWDFPRTVTFHELTDVPVYHTVTLPEVPGVTFTVKQEGVTLPLDGNTAQALSGKEVVVTAHREGYYDQELVKPGADFTENWTVTLGEWKALPVTDKLVVRITKDGLPLGSFDGLTLTLENGSDDVPFTASYPYLVLDKNHGLSEDTSLTLTVTPDASMQLTGGSDTSTLQDGGFAVALKSWGKAAVTATGTTAAPCVVILFDGAGDAVSSGTTSGGVFTSAPLPAGDYTAVAYETNDYFGAVGSKDALSALGLTPSDYALDNVAVEYGSTKELTLTVPKLNTGGLTSVLDTGKCSLAFRSSRVVTDQAFDMWVNYALKTGTAQKITFTLPAGASIQSVHNEQGPLTVDETNSVTVNNASGTLYVSVKCTETGIKSFGASVATGGTTLPLGSGTVTVQNIFIDEANRYTSEREWAGNRVSVYTKPGADVTLTIPGAATVRGRANDAGRAALTYKLPNDAAYGQSYTLTATTEDGGSAETSVTYFPDSAKLQWFGFRHYGYEITVIDNIHPTYENTYYTYFAFANERSKLFSFGAKFEADHKLDVTVTVTMQDGSVRSVPMALIGEAGGIQEYGGELYLDGNGDNHVFHADSIPVGFQIDWDDPDAPVPDEKTLYEQALASAKERQQAREDMWEELDPTDPTLTSANLTTILNNNYLNADEGIKDSIQNNIQAVVDLFNRSYGDSYSFSFFGYGYHMTDTDLFKSSIMTEDVYKRMIDEIDAVDGESIETKNDLKAELEVIYNHGVERLANARKTEAMIDDIAKQMKEWLGLKKSIQEYQSWDEVLAEKGVTYGKCTYSTDEELTNQGYTKLETDTGNCWVKETETGKTYAWPDGLDTGSSTFNARGTFNGNGNGNDNGVMLTLDSAWQTASGNYGDWQRSAAANGLGYIGDTLQNEAEASIKVLKESRETLLFKYSHSKWASLRNQSLRYIDAEEACMQAALKDAISIKNAGRAISVYNVYNDGNQMNQNIVDTAEMDAKLAELEPLMQYAKKHDNWKCWDALFAEKRAYNELTSEMHQKTRHLGLNVVMGSLFTLADVFSYGQASKADLVYDVASGAKMGMRDFKIAQLQKKIEKLHAERLSICGDDWRKMHQRNLTPILDPSGIVYEAVESNVLSGVTATIYDVTSGETLWNAGAYNQTNPQITGVDGSYAWDVPSGTWQVKFTKEGYKNAATDELDVPPPRMNLKTAMESTAAPIVISAAAYPNYVELVFSQYMSTTERLTVPTGYTYEWVNKEEVSAEDHTAYSKVLRLKKSAAVGDTVTVTLSGAKNYAGKTLAESFSRNLTVAVEPAQLRLNYETQIAVLVGEAKDSRVTVQVLDSNGQPISGLTVTAATGDTAYATVTTVQGTTDASGVAVFDLKGRFPGWTEATFAVAGSSLTRTMPVRVTIANNQAAKPAASIGGNVYTESTNSITVPCGSALTLTCATEGAVIYYTTNDTCPCQALGRQLYTGPITVNEDTYFRIAAYKDGMEYSERLNLMVRVSESSPGGGGGDSDDTPGYSATVERSENGSVSISPKSASKGDIVTITVTPDKGYTLETLTVTDSSGKELKLTEKNGKYTFTMPASKVTVKATFMENNSMLNFFVDVPADAYYYDAVLWAAENGITSGTTDTTFSPNAPCTRAQIVTFLWRAAGSPEPKGTQSFGDVAAGSYYEKAVAWAAENGITGGTGDGKFSPGATCTRAQAVTFLYRAGNASAVSSGAAFTDVAPGAYYADAVAWAAENEITGGIGGGLFAPGNNCTRAQIVTFLYRSVK